MNRGEIYKKYGGRCAYTGKELGDEWQIDHIIPKCLTLQKCHQIIDHNDIANLVPTFSIINHYKRGFALEPFRQYMLTFHLRLAKLPKKPRTEKTKKRIIYMNKIANLFDITPEKAFDGIFYFEKLEQ